ncbi:hypothetical protein HAX54_033516 [Datura stramonium]|uniref:Uncharacterized protein n=1 Tax=Datura stramonium TaxID=4076 RepID=A0ABS8RLN5_DATST|nr:hypothetical protein [Datura stramonium]
MQKFWNVFEKRKFLDFKNRPFAHGRVICLAQLEASHCSVSHLFSFQGLDNLSLRCANEAFEDLIRMFYANMKFSKDSTDPKTLVLGTKIVLSKTLFEKVFNSRFSGNIPFFTSGWPEDFEVSLDEEKLFIAEDGTNLSDFGPASIYFENYIITHIISTTFPPRKGSLSTLCQDSSGNATRPYGILVSRIIKAMSVDVSEFPVK